MRVNEGDVALACVSLLVDELVRAGLAGACAAPGSRSTPIVLALDRHPMVSLQMHLDERSAGFFALGIAKATRRPAAVVCTSGTAAANLFPAVVEAFYSGVPLIVITADRPPELRDTGANQTIDQIKMFGGFVRHFAEAGVPEIREGAARYWRSLGARASARALGPPAGPVHLNLALREPLSPAGAHVDLGPDGEGRPEGNPWERVSAPAGEPSEEAVGELAALVVSAEQGVIVAGNSNEEAPSVASLAAAAGWPLIAEPGSGVRMGSALGAAQHLLSDEEFAAAHAPEVAIQFGSAPSSRSAQAFLKSALELIVVDPGERFADPDRQAARTIRAGAEALSAAVAKRLEPRGGSRWLAEWQQADARARDAVDALLDSWDEPFEGRVARDLWAHLPPGSTMVVASSMPVRDLDAYAAPRDGVRVLANRGASGIDGFVSTVLGVASAGSPAFALSGDLSLLHDSGALLWGARRARGVVMAVVNNDGGGIFDLLPQAQLPEHERVFVTPHGLDLAKLAEAAGAAHERVKKMSEFRLAVERAASQETLSIVEVPIDRERARGQRMQVRKTVREVLAEESRRRLERSEVSG